MDRVRTELLPPLHIAELQREARREALAELACPTIRLMPMLATRIGGVLIRAGCRLEAAGQRRSATRPAAGRLTHCYADWTALDSGAGSLWTGSIDAGRGANG
jgi:hypothetical protein